MMTIHFKNGTALKISQDTADKIKMALCNKSTFITIMNSDNLTVLIVNLNEILYIN